MEDCMFQVGQRVWHDAYECWVSVLSNHERDSAFNGMPLYEVSAYGIYGYWTAAHLSEDKPEGLSPELVAAMYEGLR